MRSGLPMLVGMAATFAAVATLAAVAGGWAVEANELGRLAALALLAVFGLALVFPALSDHFTRPLVALGDRLSASADRDAAARNSTILPSLLLGVATGLLWAPCAGPVLGLILTGAALQGANGKTTLLLLAYAAGAATSLALALLVGGRVFAAMKRSLGIGEWVRRGVGVAVLAGVAAIALGLDTGFLSRVSSTRALLRSTKLLDGLQPAPAAPPQSPVVMNGGPAMAAANPAGGDNPAMIADTKREPSVVMNDSPAMMAANPGDDGEGEAERGRGKPARRRRRAFAVRRGPMAELAAADYGGPQRQGRAGRFLDLFLHQLPPRDPLHSAWAEKYRDQGLVVIGVQAFAFEKNVDNVRKAVSDLKIDYPVAIDNDYTIWRAFQNQYWPAHYFIDAQGRIRHHHFGEGDYDGSERVIQQLLAEAGKSASAGLVTVNASGVEAASDMKDVQSPETYVGYLRSENFVSNGAPCLTLATSTSSRRRASTNGACRAIGRSAARARFSTKRAEAPPTAFTPAICISSASRGVLRSAHPPAIRWQIKQTLVRSGEKR